MAKKGTPSDGNEAQEQDRPDVVQPKDKTSNEHKKNRIIPDQSIQPGKEEIKLRNAIVSEIVSLVHRIGFEPKAIASKGRTMPFAFVVDRHTIEDLDRHICESLRKLPLVPKSSVTFIGEVTYSDLTTESFDTLEKLLGFAGFKKSPVDLELSWKVLLASPLLMTAYVSITFHTDIKKDTESLGVLHFPIAYIEYEIGGVDRDWVESTGSNVEPLLESTRLRGMYKPLLIFRNQALVHVLSWTFAVLTEIIMFESTTRMLTQPAKSEILGKILNSTSLNEEFNAYMRYVFSESSWIEPVIIFGTAMFIFIFILVLGYELLPRLVPKSGILIGLEGRRYHAYENAFKFVVFTILFGGIGVGIVLELMRIFLFHS